jgi:O-antigen ligase
MTVMSYAFNDLDIYLYLAGLSYNLIPMFLYLIGMFYSQNSHEEYTNRILVSNIIILGVGVILFILRPDFYTKILTNNPYYRMESYLGSSMPIGNIAAVSIPLLFLNLFRYSKLRKTILFIIILSGLILSMQRSAWIAGLFALFFSLIIYLNKKLNLKKVLVVYSIIFIMVLVVPVVFNTFVPDYFQAHLYRRLETFDISMFTSRTDQWRTAIDIFLKYPLGYGLGSAGHKSAVLGINIVPDGNYFRILVETGLIGFVAFVIFNIQGLLNAWVKNKYIFIALLIYLMQAIGTNVLDLIYSSFIYWFLLGYIINKKSINIRGEFTKENIDEYNNHIKLQ